MEKYKIKHAAYMKINANLLKTLGELK